MSEEKTKSTIFNLKDELSEEDEDEDLVEIKLSTKTIHVNFLQLYKYSTLFHDTYLTKKSRENLSQEILDFQSQFNINENNTILFFMLIQEKNVNITNDSYRDLRKLSEYFQSKKLIKFLDKYSKNYLSEIDSIVFQILESQKSKITDEISRETVNEELEAKLSLKINECLKNSQFAKLPISIVYRIISKSDKSKISSDDLLDFINESFEERHLLFHFLRIKMLTDEKYDMLCEKFSSESEFINFYQSIPIDLQYIKSLKDEIKNLKGENNGLNSNINDLQNEINKIKDENEKLTLSNENLQKDIDEFKGKNEKLTLSNENLQKDIDEFKGKNEKLTFNNENLQKNVDKFKEDIEKLKGENNELNANNNSFQAEINKLKGENKQLQDENEYLNNQINELKKIVNKEIIIQYGTNPEFNGIFSYLKRQFGENIFNIIGISSFFIFL